VKPDTTQTVALDDEPQKVGVDFDSVPAVAGVKTSAVVNIDERPKPTRPCCHCDRKFNLDVIEKHEKVCITQKKRPQFNSKQHRLADLNEAQKQVNSTDNRATLRSDIPVKRAGWKEKSDQLRAAVALARSTDPAKRRIYEAELARVNEAVLTRCDYCGRSFNADSAQRHIPICRNKSMMIPRNPPGKVTLAGTGSSVKLPSLHRSRSEAPTHLPQKQTTSSGVKSSTSNFRGSSLIKSYFR
jgi:hypothetical protein